MRIFTLSFIILGLLANILFGQAENFASFGLIKAKTDVFLVKCTVFRIGASAVSAETEIISAKIAASKNRLEKSGNIFSGFVADLGNRAVFPALKSWSIVRNISFSDFKLPFSDLGFSEVSLLI